MGVFHTHQPISLTCGYGKLRSEEVVISSGEEYSPGLIGSLILAKRLREAHANDQISFIEEKLSPRSYRGAVDCHAEQSVLVQNISTNGLEQETSSAMTI